MSLIKNELEKILACEICKGSGISEFWSSPDGDYDLEWCECNPNHLTPEY